MKSTYAAHALRSRCSVLAVQYTCVLRNRGCDGGEPSPRLLLNKQQQPAQLGPNCTDARGSRRGWRRWPSSRKALAPRRVQENQARRLYTTGPGRSTSNAPGFLYSFGPLSPRGQRPRAGHQVEPGDGCCVISTACLESGVPTESTPIRDERTRGGQQHMVWCGEMATLHALLEPN